MCVHAVEPFGGTVLANQKPQTMGAGQAGAYV